MNFIIANYIAIFEGRATMTPWKHASSHPGWHHIFVCLSFLLISWWDAWNVSWIAPLWSENWNQISWRHPRDCPGRFRQFHLRSHCRTQDKEDGVCETWKANGVGRKGPHNFNILQPFRRSAILLAFGPPGGAGKIKNWISRRFDFFRLEDNEAAALLAFQPNSLR